HGSVHVAAQLTPTRLDANATVKQFDLARLPTFVLPPDLGLFGLLDANVSVSGAKSRPELDLQADVRAAGVRRTAGLPLDAHARAHLHAGRFAAQGFARGAGGTPELRFDADAPVRAQPDLSASTPVRIDVALGGLDLSQLAGRLHLEAMQQQQMQGTVEARLLASGTLGAPRAPGKCKGRRQPFHPRHRNSTRAAGHGGSTRRRSEFRKDARTLLPVRALARSRVHVRAWRAIERRAARQARCERRGLRRGGR